MTAGLMNGTLESDLESFGCLICPVSTESFRPCVCVEALGVLSLHSPAHSLILVTCPVAMAPLLQAALLGHHLSWTHHLPDLCEPKSQGGQGYPPS